MYKFIWAVGMFLALAAGNPLLANEDMVVISGKVNRENARSVILFQVLEGKKTEYASTKLDAEGRFGFALPSVKEGFYYLSLQNKREFTRLYLKNGEKLSLELNENGYELKSGSKENQILNEWSALFSEVSYQAFNFAGDTSGYISFFPKLEKLLPMYSAYKSKIKTKDPRSTQLLSLAIDMDLENAAISFLLTPRVFHPKKEQYPAFYNQIMQPGKYKSALLLEIGETVELLNRYTVFNLLMNGRPAEKPVSRLKAQSDLFGNDTLKGAYIAGALNFKTYEEMETEMAPVKHLLFTDSMQAAYFRTMKALAGFKKGSPAYKFSYPDISGKNVTMDDLKGKVVLVDVWATWCGPCKVEVPHMKKLEEEFKGKEVQFVSISVDVEKDREKWKKMVDQQQLGGMQLFASGWSEITKYYDITGIPRFLVFDKEGKIVSVDAPRPSQPELKVLLEQTLEGK